MDFKQYVKMMLEAEEAEDKNKKAKDQDDEDEDDEDDEEDDEMNASCRTKKNGCTGCEASVDDEDDDDDDDEDDEEDEDEEENKHPKSLKESMIYSSNYIAGNTVFNEEEKIRVQVLCESIKNNSASKFLMKLSTKATKDAEKLSSKGISEKAKIARDSAKQLKEASTKIRKAEDAYKAGKPEAKKEYKDLCKQYHKELKRQGRVARGIRNTVISLIAGSALLGTVGLTVMANDDIIPKLQDGIRDGKLDKVIKDMAVKDKEALIGMINNARNSHGYDEFVNEFEKSGKESFLDKASDKIGETGEKIKKGIKNARNSHGYNKFEDELEKSGKENFLDKASDKIGEVGEKIKKGIKNARNSHGYNKFEDKF